MLFISYRSAAGVPLDLIDRGRQASIMHFDRKTNAVNSLTDLITGLFGGGDESDSGESSESSSGASSSSGGYA